MGLFAVADDNKIKFKFSHRRVWQRRTRDISKRDKQFPNAIGLQICSSNTLKCWCNAWYDECTQNCRFHWHISSLLVWLYVWLSKTFSNFVKKLMRPVYPPDQVHSKLITHEFLCTKELVNPCIPKNWPRFHWWR